MVGGGIFAVLGLAPFKYLKGVCRLHFEGLLITSAITLLAAAFSIEAIYRKFTGRQILQSIL
jgi:hypothetical protein